MFKWYSKITFEIKSYWHLKGDVRTSEKTCKPGNDSIEERNCSQKGDQVGDNVANEKDGVGRALSGGIQRVGFRSLFQSIGMFI